MPYSHLSDEDLVKSLSEGSQGAFEELYRRYKEKLMGFLVCKLKSKEMAEEVFQSVWIRVIEKSYRFNIKRAFSPWLMTIAHNLVKDTYRKTVHYDRLLKSYYSSQIGNKKSRSESFDFSFLNQDAQELISLKYQEGLTSREISEKLRLSESNVRKILSRSIKKIKKHILDGGEI